MITTEIVKRIVGFRGKGLPVVSLYVRVPTDPSSRGAIVRSQVDSQLHQSGRPVRRTPDIVGELVQVVIDEGGSIEHVSADTALKKYVVAASLRFPLPPEPEQ